MHYFVSFALFASVIEHREYIINRGASRDHHNGLMERGITAAYLRCPVVVNVHVRPFSVGLPFEFFFFYLLHSIQFSRARTKCVER